MSAKELQEEVALFQLRPTLLEEAIGDPSNRAMFEARVLLTALLGYFAQDTEVTAPPSGLDNVAQPPARPLVLEELPLSSRAHST